MCTSDLLVGYEQWERRRGLTVSTIERRRDTLRAWQRWLDGCPCAATNSDVEAWLDSRHDVTGRGVPSARYRRWLISTLHGFYRWAVDVGACPADPTVGVVRPRVRRGLPRPIGDADLDVAVRLADPQMRAWLLLMAYAGLRCAEVAGLERGDVADSGGLPVLRVCGKGGRERIVPAHPLVLMALRAAGLPGSGRLFVRSDGQPFTPSQVSRRVNWYLRSLGVSDSAHSLRHWFGTNLYAQCHDLRVVQELLGHESLEMAALYAQWSRVAGRQAVEGLPVRLAA
ncbi:MAG: tyrosine-type recombinase/integrase [Acidimicrobiales bacterium]|nr:tyrosine-type recombinase/integrase [Acidimicrobiales bacterium]